MIYKVSLMKTKIIAILIASLSLIQTSGNAQQKVHPFTLKACIQYGLENHPSVEVYNNKIERAHQVARESLSAYLPQVSINAGVDDNLKLQQTVIPAGTFGPDSKEQRVAFGTQYNGSASAQLNQKIYDQSLLIGIKANEPNNKLARIQQQQNNEDLIYNIASSYYQILVAQKKLSLLESNKDRFEKILDVTELQAKEGAAKKVDVQQVQVNLNNVLSQISTTRNSLEIAINTLKNNIGLGPADSIVLTDTSRWLHQAPTLKSYPEFDYSGTLESQLQKTQIKLYDLNKRSIKAEFIPSLSMYARYGANSFAQELSGLYNPLLDYSAIGIQLSWNIFTGFNRNARYKEADIDMKNALVNYRLNRSLQNLQYQNAESQANEAQRTIVTNKENMDLASEVYDNTTLQYRHGVASLSDLLNAELSYKEAQNNYIESLLQYYLADLSVHKANGTLGKYFNQL